MKVDELILDGFKSYATRTVIGGWDPQFNAITGLNGSGKSNILDAICFVLGISLMSTVRAQNLQDLIYKRGQAGVTKALVTIVFDNSDVLRLPIGFEQFPQISVTRQIILGGLSKYLINGHKAQQVTVLNLFQLVQLNINNPNFLIMQGKITKVLNMKPAEILALIEEAAGTRTFEDRREKAQRTMQKKEHKLAEIRLLLQEEIEPKLDKLRAEKRHYLDYQQTQLDLEKLTRVILAHNYVRCLQQFDHHLHLLGSLETRRVQTELACDKWEREIGQLQRDLDQAKRQHAAEMQHDSKLKALEQRENELLEEAVRLAAMRDIASDNLKAEQAKLQRIQNQVDAARAHLSQLSGQDHQQKYESAKQELDALKQLYNSREELLSTLSTGVSASGSTDGGYLAQLQESKAKLTEGTVAIEQAKLKIEHLQAQLQSDKPKLQQAQRDNDEAMQEIEAHRRKISDGQTRLKLMGFDSLEISRLKEEHRRLEGQVYLATAELNQLQRHLGNNLDFNYTAPSQHFNPQSVKGVAAQLFLLQSQHRDKALALQVCAGGRLYNVIVDTSDTASQLLERGQLRKRVTIIPLDKISARVMSERAVSMAQQLRPGKVDLALHLVGYDQELRQAMEYIFGNTLICQDPETAKTVTFDPQIRARSITLEGDVYDPEGNLSGGSRKVSSSILLTIQQYNELQSKVNEWQAQLTTIDDKMRAADRLNLQTRALQDEINLATHEVELLTRKLEHSSSATILSRNEKAAHEIDQLQATIKKQEAQCQAYRHEIDSIERDIKEFSSDKGSKLKKLEQEVRQIHQQLTAKEQEIARVSEQYQALQMESEQQQSELASLEEDQRQCEAATAELQASIEEMSAKVKEEELRLQQVRAQLEDERANLVGISEEINELAAAIQTKTESLGESKLAVQKLKHEIEKLAAILRTLKQQLDTLVAEQEWVLDPHVLDSIIQQNPNINLANLEGQVAILEERFQGMRRKVNTNIMNMIDNVEKKESALRQMIRTIEKDKAKIENTVEKLNGYKRSTLDVTYKKVSVDFGNIFADLLPGSFAKLVPVDAEDVTRGLEVKVKLGPVWKESLVELSGGQRSLIALSLIMALLQFKPAPMYILDEVDAALDLSHTQNIGHLIKTRFKGSQFIVVSLKEGMFTNANRVFRTRFQDGTSVVSQM